MVSLSLSSLGILVLVGLGLGRVGCLARARTNDLSFCTAGLTGFAMDSL